MSNAHNTTLYVGVTSDLVGRVWKHKNGFDKKSFTYKYNINKLVHCENCQSIESAIAREKQIKSWSRKRKIELIEEDNHEWNDLSKDWF